MSARPSSTAIWVASGRTWTPSGSGRPAGPCAPGPARRSSVVVVELESPSIGPSRRPPRRPPPAVAARRRPSAAPAPPARGVSVAGVAGSVRRRPAGAACLRRRSGVADLAAWRCAGSGSARALRTSARARPRRDPSGRPSPACRSAQLVGAGRRWRARRPARRPCAAVGGVGRLGLTPCGGRGRLRPPREPRRRRLGARGRRPTAGVGIGGAGARPARRRPSALARSGCRRRRSPGGVPGRAPGGSDIGGVPFS